MYSKLVRTIKTKYSILEDTFGKDTGAFRVDKIQYYTVSTEYTIYSKFTVDYFVQHNATE